MTEMSPLPFDHPVMMVQKMLGTPFREEQELSLELIRGAKKILGAAMQCCAYRETKSGIGCGMDWLGEIRSCKRKDVSGEHVPPLAVSESPHWYQATLDEPNRIGRR